MQGDDPLARLQPLRQPLETGWWPPAPGWWLLAALVLLLAAAGAWQLWRRHQRRRYRRQALAQLEALQASWPANDPAGFGGQCNRLLKIVALRSFPGDTVAALSGEAWSEFLNASVKAGKENSDSRFTPAFDLQLYRPDGIDPASRDQLYRASRRWIAHHEAAS
ncbi:DUF4381 domain-containing protein [Parahaliea maris]|uniref:DUF4381 domain-containing protein n=1 Tax=Parahaliea maris TaxID=2716870 RepID=UPI00164F62A4|nr:DUF4381 domain-containing protein [Parahaliea maris]